MPCLFVLNRLQERRPHRRLAEKTKSFSLTFCPKFSYWETCNWIPWSRGHRLCVAFYFSSTSVYPSLSLSIYSFLLKGTQDWEFFWLRFWNLRYFFVSYVKILRFYKKNFLIGPLLGEVRFFRVVLGLRRMKKNFELGPKKFFFLLQFWTLNMTQY